MFKDPKDEDDLIKMLKALVSEWEAERITVCLPKVWQDDKYEGTLKPCKLEFSTENTIELRVMEFANPIYANANSIIYQYTKELAI